ncbi:hypothetical protein [Halobacillus seohaensis]|uniref:Uncharacterized protein n=1 Tax=Halobacillus seohaensis TaxID=447421 RepID=A0ABW2EKM7_9BACI
MLNKYLAFIFYFTYLIGAELPLFIILLIRNLYGGQPENINFILALILLSLIINLSFFYSLYFNVKRNSTKEKNRKILREVTSNKLAENLNNFFALFLLPFFTFNFSSNEPLLYLLVEMIFIFILLTIFLFRTKNITTNLLVYISFDIYEAKTPGQDVILITDSRKEELQNERKIICRILHNFYAQIDSYSAFVTKIKSIITFLMVLLIVAIGFLIKLNTNLTFEKILELLISLH